MMVKFFSLLNCVVTHYDTFLPLWEKVSVWYGHPTPVLPKFANSNLGKKIATQKLVNNFYIAIFTKA